MGNIEEIECRPGAKEKNDAALYADRSILNQPALIVVHGFKGYKDWGFFPYICRQFADAGILTLCFNFSNSAVTDPVRMLYNVEKFAGITVSGQLNELDNIISNLENTLEETKLKDNWNGSIFLLGHSLGSAVSILQSAKDRRIGKTAVWASIAKFDRYTPRQKKQWLKDGYLEFTNNQTGQQLKLNITFLNDILDNLNNYSVPDNAARLKSPLLIVHGKEDLTVPMKEPESIYEAADKQKSELFVIEKTGHTFGIVHPFTKTTCALDKTVKKTIDFFIKD